MKHQDSDKEIASLYQQRKQQVVAPEISFAPLQKNKKPRYTIVQLLSILFFGGATSFGILAVISHFSTQPNIQPNLIPQTKLRVVELDAEEIKPADKVIPIVIPPLIPKKPYVAPVHSKHESVLETKNIPNELTFALPVDVVIVSVTPSIKQSELSLVPLYQEQPKYSNSAIRSQETGKVKLAYIISPQGKVSNITTVESTANRELNYSARKALSNWRYRAGEYSEAGYEITFNFTLENKQ
jgi:TonB family protein